METMDFLARSNFFHARSPELSLGVCESSMYACKSLHGPALNGHHLIWVFHAQRVPSAYLSPALSWRELPPDCVKLLFEVPSLRVICIYLVSLCISKAILNFWRSFWARRRHFSAKFRHFQNFVPQLNSWKTNFLRPLAYPGVFSIKSCAGFNARKQNPSVE